MLKHRSPDLSDVSIVVLSYNRRETLGASLPALARIARETGCELVVVDNASTDGSAVVINQALAGTKEASFIVNDVNKGVAGGRNSGWARATRDLILNLDDDITITASDIERLAQLLRSSPRVGIAGPTIIDRESGQVQFEYAPGPVEPANFQGACHMIRRDLAIGVGCNDELCSFGAEELDLSIRVRAEGYSVIYTNTATALHDHKIREGHEAMTRRELCVYNFIRIFYKHFPLQRALPLSLRCLTSHIASATQNFGFLFSLRVAKAGLMGCLHGRKQYKQIPIDVVRFYRDPELRPEFGNRPLWQKLIDRQYRRTIRTSSHATTIHPRIAARDR